MHIILSILGAIIAVIFVAFQAIAFIGAVAEIIIKFAAVFLLALPPLIIFTALQIFQAFDCVEYAAFIENHICILAIIGYVIEYLILKYRCNVTNFL